MPMWNTDKSEEQKDSKIVVDASLQLKLKLSNFIANINDFVVISKGIT